MRKNQGVSIIICCYNSVPLLEQTLKHILAQRLNDGLACELILVDNGSSDNTLEVAKSIWLKNKTSKIDLKIFEEPRPGTAYARQKGVDEARYEYIIFCDHDNWLDQTYVGNVSQLFNMHNDVAILGGTGIAQFENESLKPDWFDTFCASYAIGAQSQNEIITTGVYGAGMAVRNSVLKMVMSKGVMFLEDRKGKQHSAGGDTEICMQIRLAGYKILYSPALTFGHYVTVGRLKWDYLKKISVGFAQTNVVINLYDKVLNSQNATLSPFYWLKQGLYYWGIYLKYWPKHYAAYKKGEGTIEEIHHLTWKNIALSYFEYNFETVTIYKKIEELKKKISGIDQDAI